MPLEKRYIVTNFLRFEDKILILRRSGKVGTYKGKWAGVSGYIEKDDINPENRAKIEIFEETGLTEKEIKLVKEGNPLDVVDNRENILWIVHPFLWDASTDRIKIDWEHLELKWIASIDELDDLNTVPNLKETLKEVY